MAYLDVEATNGDREIGSAFHVGSGIFVTARHVVQGKRIVEMRQTEPVTVGSRENFQKFPDLSDETLQEYDKAHEEWTGLKPTFPRYLEPLEIIEGPFYDKDEISDVAVLRVREIHPAAAIVKLGIHWDDWVYRNIWNLTDAIIMGYPPVPMVNQPVLISARAEIHTFVTPRHDLSIHFILSATPRGGFSGGVAIYEDGDALGVITSSFVNDGLPEQTGFLAVLSIEAIVKCLQFNGL
jgi:hypothetical protein